MRSATATPGSKFLSGTRASASTGGMTKTVSTGGMSKGVTASPKVAQGMSKSYLSQQIASKMSQASKGVVPNAPAIVNKATSVAARLAPKIAGRALGVAGLAIPDSTKTEPGDPVFRKTDTGKAQVAGYRSSTTPSASVKNTQTGMVGSLARRGGLAPSVKNQELPAKIAPVQTKEPGTLSAPVAKSATAPSSFKQAFAQARKEAGTMGAKSTGQFEYKGGKYQTNIQGKGTAKAPEEKFVPMSQQKVTSVGKSSTPAATPSAAPASSAPKAEPAPSTANRQGLARPSAGSNYTATAPSGSLSPTPVKQQDTGLSAAQAPDDFTSRRLAPERTPTAATRVPTGIPDMAGTATKPKNATSDTGGFIPPAPEVKASVSGAADTTNASTPSKRPPNLQEEVQVGNHKYRIV